jgi:hypothetical protein
VFRYFQIIVPCVIEFGEVSMAKKPHLDHLLSDLNTLVERSQSPYMAHPLIRQLVKKIFALLPKINSDLDRIDVTQIEESTFLAVFVGVKEVRDADESIVAQAIDPLVSQLHASVRPNNEVPSKIPLKRSGNQLQDLIAELTQIMSLSEAREMVEDLPLSDLEDFLVTFQDTKVSVEDRVQNKIQQDWDDVMGDDPFAAFKIDNVIKYGGDLK